jgi:hypothetical protein
MSAGTGAQGFLGFAVEVTPGTYVAPTNFVPVMSESLTFMQDTVWRRPIRQSADLIGAVAGNSHVEGDVSMELFEDVLAIMMRGARASYVKSGTTPNFTYVFTGTPNAIPATTLSITVVRNGVVFGYTGMVISGFTITIDNGLLMFNPTFMGRDEAVQSLPVATWPTGVQATPFGAGQYKLEIPVATQVFDADTFTFTVDDAATPAYRLKDTNTGAQFITYGERAVTMSIERDFDTRTDYDAFKSETSQDIQITATKGTNNVVILEVPVAIKDTYEVALSGQGDLTRSAIAYNGVVDATGNAYKLTVKTQGILP